MKLAPFIVLFFLVFNSTVIAQIDFAQLRTPSSPAFIVLDQTPNSIERPSSLNTLSSTIQSAYSDGKLKPGIGIEVTPFMLVPKINYLVEDYLRAEALQKKNYGRMFLQHLSFSVATSSSDSFTLGNIQSGLGLSYGARFLIFPGTIPHVGRNKQPNQYENLYQTYLQIKDYTDVKNNTQNMTIYTNVIDDIDNQTTINIEILKNIVNSELVGKDSLLRALIKLIDDKQAQNSSFLTNKDSVKLLISGIRDNTEAVLRTNITNLSKTLSTAREGFMWEFACAGLTVFGADKFENHNFGKFAFWTTLSYRINANTSNSYQSVDIMAVARYTINNHMKVDSSNYFDYGFKLQVNRKKWDLSAEFVQRYATKPAHVADSVSLKPKNYTYRLTVAFDYQITNYLGLNVTFGKSFDGVSSTFDQKGTQSIFSTGGLNVGIGNIKKQN